MSDRILIVDDHEDNRYTLRRRLKREGYANCVEAENGQQAVELLEKEAFDLVLLDLMMPVMDGFQVLERLKKQDKFRHLPIIMISAADDLDKVAKGIELGAEDYLPKPFNPVILKARVQSALEKRQKALAQLDDLKYLDKQTGLPNEAALLERNDTWALRSSKLAVIELVFSKYSMLVDGYNKSAADAYVAHQLSSLKENFSDFGELYRVTNACFVLLVDDFDDADSLLIKVQEMHQSLNDSLELDGITVVEELQIGIALGQSEQQEDRIETLLQHASTASSQATKFMPINFYADEVHSSIMEKIRLEADLRKAISNDELTLYYQPQVSAQNGKILAAEALVRWIHPERGMISPVEFIPLAEETGLVIALGESVIRIAVRQIAQWNQQWSVSDWSLPISVNVSAQHVVKPELTQYIRAMLEQYQLAPTLLKVELTESALVDDESGTIDILKSIQALGLKISLDDFGTGFSSLSYLLELPLNQLKIDKKFVDNLVNDRRSRAVFKHVVNLAHDLDLDVVVEGVETSEQAQLVNQAGVDFIQGYYYYKPMPADDFYNAVCLQCDE